MKLTINQSDEYQDIEIIKIAVRLTLRWIGSLNRFDCTALLCMEKKDGGMTLIPPEKSYYFESIDGKTFIYKKQDVYECDFRLYEIEERLCKGFLVRISKKTILNLKKLKSFRTQLNGKLEAHLKNGERLEISKHYVPELKQRLMKMGGEMKTLHIIITNMFYTFSVLSISFFIT